MELVEFFKKYGPCSVSFYAYSTRIKPHVALARVRKAWNAGTLRAAGLDVANEMRYEWTAEPEPDSEAAQNRRVMDLAERAGFGAHLRNTHRVKLERLVALVEAGAGR